jgi:hypothetical protein
MATKRAAVKSPPSSRTVTKSSAPTRNRRPTFYTTYYKWLLLAAIALVYIFWFLLYGMNFFIGDFVEEISEAEGIHELTDQHSLIVTLLLRLVLSTGIGILLFELIANIGIVAMIWYSLVTLHNLGLSRKCTNAIAAVYCFFPMYFFIANFMSKDQLFCSVVFALAVQLYKLLNTKNYQLKQFIIIGILFGGSILLKTFFAILILAFVFFAIAVKRFWKPIIITGSVALVSALVIQVGLVNALGAKSIASHDILSVPMQATGAIFNDPNANISEEDREYYDNLYNNDYFRELNPTVEPELWYTLYVNLMSDKLKFPLWYVEMNIPEYVGRTTTLCFKNFGTCVQSYLTLMSGFFLPIEISYPLTNSFRNPTFSQYTSDIGDNYISTQTNTINSGRICSELEDTTSTGTIAATPLTFEGYKECLIRTLGESRGAAVADSLHPLIRDSLLGNSIAPGLAQTWLDVWHAGKFFLEGFWVFYVSLVLLIIALAHPRFKRLRPMIAIVWVLYIGLFMVSPVAYERYLIPTYMILPFLIGVYILERKRSRRGQARSGRSAKA